MWMYIAIASIAFNVVLAFPAYLAIYEMYLFRDFHK